MANVIIVIAIMVIAFILAGYGVYYNVQADRRTQLAMAVSTTIERQVEYVQNVAMDLGRSPPATADLDLTRFVRESSGAITFSYAVLAGTGYVCATIPVTDDMSMSAMQKVVTDHPGAFLSGTCGLPDDPVADAIAVSMKVN